MAREALFLDLEDNFYFYRCEKCNRLVTCLEEIGLKKTGISCPNGHTRYSPTDLKWYEWAYPRVWVVAFLKLRREIEDAQSNPSLALRVARDRADAMGRGPESGFSGVIGGGLGDPDSAREADPSVRIDRL